MLLTPGPKRATRRPLFFSCRRSVSSHEKISRRREKSDFSYEKKIFSQEKIVRRHRQSPNSEHVNIPQSQAGSGFPGLCRNLRKRFKVH
ncbi:MAG: hypothetical protein JSR83_00170 [Proteobacteria bacterium]|nr:hypothetical protein [Pseudomonadota bacterium]